MNRDEPYGREFVRGARVCAGVVFVLVVVGGVIGMAARAAVGRMIGMMTVVVATWSRRATRLCKTLVKVQDRDQELADLAAK